MGDLVSMPTGPTADFHTSDTRGGLGNAPGTMPSLQSPIVDAQGRLTPAWARHMASQLPNPQAAKGQTLGASPYSFTAPGGGSLIVSGGTVSSMSLTRGRQTFDLGATSGHFPASPGDKFTIDFSDAPTVTFLPG